MHILQMSLTRGFDEIKTCRALRIPDNSAGDNDDDDEEEEEEEK